MRKFALLTALTFALLVASMAVLVGQARRSPAVTWLPNLPANLRPGVSRNDLLGCDFYYFNTDECRKGDYYVSFDRTQEVIQHVSYILPTEMYANAGQVILAEGLPTGYRSGGILQQLFFGDHYVYVVGRPFDPYSQVFLVGWYPWETPDAWKGFINER